MCLVPSQKLCKHTYFGKKRKKKLTPLFNYKRQCYLIRNFSFLMNNSNYFKWKMDLSTTKVHVTYIMSSDLEANSLEHQGDAALGKRRSF